MTNFPRKISTLLFALILLTVNMVSSQDNEMELIINEKKGFSVEKPINWTKTDDNTPGKSLMILQGPGIDNYVTNMTFIVEEGNSSTPNEHAKKLVAQYTKTYKEIEVTNEDKEVVSLNNNLFSSFVIKMKFGDIDYKMRTIFTIKEKKVYQINVFSPESKYDKDLETINKIISSFKIL